MKKFTAQIALAFAISIQIFASATTLQDAKEQAQLEQFKVTTGGARQSSEVSVDDSNWMAIVDLVQASSLQLMYHTELQVKFDQDADAFFTGLEDLAERTADATDVSAASEASDIRNLLKTFIKKVTNVLSSLKLEVKELLEKEESEANSGLEEEDEDDNTDA